MIAADPRPSGTQLRVMPLALASVERISQIEASTGGRR